MGAGQSRNGYDPRDPYGYYAQQRQQGPYGTYADPGRRRRRGYSDPHLPHNPPYPPPQGYGPPPPPMGYPAPGYPGHHPGYGAPYGQPPYGQMPPQRPPSPRAYDDGPPLRPLPPRPVNVYTLPQYRHLRHVTTTQFSMGRTDLSSSTQYEIVRPGDDDPTEVGANAMNGSSVPFMAAHQRIPAVALTPAAVPLPETPATMLGQPTPASVPDVPPFIPPSFEQEGLPGSSRFQAGPPISFDGSNIDEPFSLYSRSSIFYKKRLYPSAAHLYYAHMFLGSRGDIAEELRLMEDPKSVRFLAQRHTSDRRASWSSMKLDETLYHKFTQHQNLLDRLIETDPRPLVNADMTDPVLGVGNDGTGINELGRSLMRVRDRIMREGGLRSF